MQLPRLAVLCAGSLLLCACGTELTTAPEIDLEPSFATFHGPRMARGRGYVPAGNGRREFSFRARQRRDGSVRGRYEIRLTERGLFFKVDVSCASFEGNTAWIAGHITESNASFIEIGSVSYFFAIDNGHGSGAEPDVVSTARINDAAGEDVRFCEERPLLLPSLPIEGGRVRIR